MRHLWRDVQIPCVKKDVIIFSFPLAFNVGVRYINYMEMTNGNETLTGGTVLTKQKSAINLDRKYIVDI